VNLSDNECQRHTLQKPAPENGHRFFMPAGKFLAPETNTATVLLVSWFTYVDVCSYLLAVTVKLFLFTRWQQCYYTSNTPI